jgi:membrane-associated phospholipid phosphatase
MINNICNNILSGVKWLKIKVIFSIFVAFLFLILFLNEYNKEKSDEYFCNGKDIATFVRNIDFFIPIVYSVATKNPILFAEYSFISIGISGVVEISKYFIHEERPDKSNNHSFPSGHSAIAFLVAHFLCLRINKFAGIFFYLVAFGIAYSRVYYGKHWIHDVVVGGLLAIFMVQFAKNIGCYFLELIKKI